MTATRRWAIVGAALGALTGLILFAPATLLARGLQEVSEGRLVLAEARGTVWSGDAVVVLTGGTGSRDAAVLPGRLFWQIGIGTQGLEVRLRQPCCLHDTQTLVLKPGLGRFAIQLPPSPQLGRWPASWLVGLGTPWNTLQLAGTLRLSAPDLHLENVQGRWRVQGQLSLALDHVASSISTLPELGSYRLDVVGDAKRGDGARLTLTTASGALRMQGQGQWAGAKLHFRGDARAEPGAERALDNLLNIIGRRQGALSLIAIG